MLTQTGVPLAPALMRLLPLPVEVVLFGWTLQLGMGIAFWILPRFSQKPCYGHQPFNWAAFSLINGGVLGAGLAARQADWWLNRQGI